MTVTSQLKIFDAQFAAGIDFKALTGILGMKSSTICEYYVGEHINMTLQDLSGNGRHLSPAGSPAPSALTDLYMLDNNKMPVKRCTLNGSSMYFTRAHEAWMDFAQADFSMTFWCYGYTTNKYLLGHGTTSTNGFTVYADASAYPCCALHKSGAARVATIGTGMLTNLNLIHINRSGTSFTISLNGSDGSSPGDPATYGIAATDPMYFGCYRGPANYWGAGVVYWRANLEPVSADQRAAEYAYLRGVLAKSASKKFISYSFARSTLSIAERRTGPIKVLASGTMQVQSNVAAKMAEGGLLIQETMTQLSQYSNAFHASNKYWTPAGYVSLRAIYPSGSAAMHNVAMSDSGQYLIVNSNLGYPYFSADYGATWTKINYPNTAGCVGISRSGQYMACHGTASALLYLNGNYGSGAFASKNLGANQNLYNICISDDGQNILLGTGFSGNSDHLIVSNDGGTNWNHLLSVGQYRVAMSTDGTYCYAYCNTPATRVWYSSNHGVAWTQSDYAVPGESICCDSSGLYVYILRAGSGVYKSTDYGHTFTLLSISPSSVNNHGLCCSGDGRVLALTNTAGNQPLYVSVDYGVSWFNILTNAPFGSIALSSDGTYLATTFYNANTQVMVYQKMFDLHATSDDSATPLAPDGTGVHKIVADSSNVEHGIAQLWPTNVSSVYYTHEVEAYAGDKDWVHLSNRSVVNAYAYFHIPTRSIGTVGAGCIASVHPERSRFAISFLNVGGLNNDVLQISPANADGDVDFAGDGSTANIYIWESSYHLGKFQMLPLNNPSIGLPSRAADNLVYSPSDIFTDLKMGNNYRTKKLRFKWKVKCQYNSVTDIGSNVVRAHFCIGGATGTAGNTRNHIRVCGYNQYVYASFYSDLSSTERWIRFTVADAAQYHVYDLTLDFTNLANSTFTKDGVAATSFSPDMVDAHDFDTASCLLRVGQENTGTISGDCIFDYLTMWEHIA